MCGFHLSKKVGAIKALRLIPGVSAGMMLAHVAMLLMGITEQVTEVVMVCFGFLLAWLFSSVLGFCGIHRAMILYAYAVMVCTWWQRHTDGFGCCLTAARVVMLLVGLFLFSIYIIKTHECKK